MKTLLTLRARWGVGQLVLRRAAVPVVGEFLYHSNFVVKFVSDFRQGLSHPNKDIFKHLQIAHCEAPGF